VGLPVHEGHSQPDSASVYTSARTLLPLLLGCCNAIITPFRRPHLDHLWQLIFYTFLIFQPAIIRSSFAERHDAPAVHVPRPGSAARLGASWHPSGSGPRLPPLPPHGPDAARPAADALAHARRARASPRAAQRGRGAALRRPAALLVQDVQAGGHQSQAPPDPGKGIRSKARATA